MQIKCTTVSLTLLSLYSVLDHSNAFSPLNLHHTSDLHSHICPQVQFAIIPFTQTVRSAIREYCTQETAFLVTSPEWWKVSSSSGSFGLLVTFSPSNVILLVCRVTYQVMLFSFVILKSDPIYYFLSHCCFKSLLASLFQFQHY